MPNDDDKEVDEIETEGAASGDVMMDYLKEVIGNSTEARTYQEMRRARIAAEGQAAAAEKRAAKQDADHRQEMAATEKRHRDEMRWVKIAIVCNGILAIAAIVVAVFK
ncbi:MAG: hypothetical protein KA763_14305 [Xanthomonadales bacterium]|nr:hypothetical protein [Xanthomonadales bacterium]